ncbi:hypothetical protein B0H13DRAFT_644336 [Mycena leptocephala]|nr:hypothetical protein B0H13DRAFT_644336 [Mycena leptocephala]
MDPTVLGQFLQRHPTIGHIGFSRSGEDTDSFATGRTLCSPPVVLPNLIRLYANDGFALIDLLNAFDCPRVSIIGIRITRPNLRYVTGLKALLHRLSLRTQRTKIELTPSLASPGDRIPLDDDEKAIVRSLHSVHCVCLMTADLAEAQKALPWLMLLPALRRLELSNMIRANLNPLDFDDPDLVAFMEEARAALPGVTEFVVANRLFW